MWNIILDKFNEIDVDGEIVFLGESGSSLHGTFIDGKSDRDYKGVYIPSKKSIFLNRVKRTISFSTGAKESKNTSEDIDVELMSIGFFLELLGKGEINAIEMLFSMKPGLGTIVIGSTYSNYLYSQRGSLIVNKAMAFAGFALNQAAKYSVKGERVQVAEEFLEELGRYPGDKPMVEYRKRVGRFIDSKNSKFLRFEQLEEGEYIYFLGKLLNMKGSLSYTMRQVNRIYNMYGSRARKAKVDSGVDYKALSHAVRAIYEGVELLETKNIDFPLRNAPLLLDIKMGGVDVEEISEIIEEGLHKLSEATEKSDLPTDISSEREVVLTKIYEMVGFL